MSTPFADQADRNRIRTAHTNTLFVEAGAGTGKTTALVARVVDMVATAHLTSIDGLAAITFTENAAAELRSRIREGLEDGARGAHRGAAYDDAQRARCRSALDHLDDAVIATLHGWATRILGEAPLEAGLPPTFTIATAAGGHDLVAEDWQDALSDLLADETLQRHVVAGLTLGLSLDKLREVATALSQSWDRLVTRPLRARPMPRVDASSITGHLRRAVQDAPAWPAGDRLTDFLQEWIVPLLDALEHAREEADVLDLLTEKVLKNVGNKAAWTAAGLDKGRVIDALTRAEDERLALLGAVGAAVTETLAARLQDWVLEQSTRRRTEGALDYHDLLVHARDLLRAERSVREKLHAAWPVLMIDEFQDTDPLQIEIACLIAGDCGAAPPTHWSQIPIPDGRLFFVGDAKQSIYRFRRADVATFAAVGDEHDSGRSGLTVNFRSVPGVLAAANHAFDELIGSDPGAGMPYSRLHPARAAVVADQPPVLLLGGPHPGAGAATLRQQETEHIADVIVRAKAEGWLVGDGRPATFSDVAVLLPTRTTLPALQRALDARGVPYRIESRSLVWSTEAVRNLVTLLQAIDSPADEVALLAALRQPGLACSDVDLLEWRAAGGRWSLFARTPDELTTEHPVASALQLLRGWHERRWWIPVNHLVDEVVRELRLVELTASQPRPRDHWRRLRFVVDQARAWCDAGGAGLSGFVAWAVQQTESDADLLETVVPEADDDAVRILTVHGSKGLEFPITVVAGLSSSGRRTDSVLWADTGPLVRFKADVLEMAGWPDATTTEDAERAREATRLLYVALTRAMDHLVIGCYYRPPKTKSSKTSAAQRLWELLSPAGLVRTEAAPPPSATDPLLEPVTTWSIPDRDAFSRDRAQLLADLAARVATSPTALARERASSDESTVPVDVPLTAPQRSRGSTRRGGRGAAIGTAVHRVLELATLPTPAEEELQALALAACLAQGIPDLVTDVAGRVRTALASDVAQHLTPESSWREVYLVVDDGTRYVEGYIDLLAETDDGRLVVVDWKTDRAVTAAEMAAKRELYRPQLSAYADAVERVLGRRPETHLVFARPTSEE
ncbi:UvrD-helicase domain-containing protein [Kineococcus sp. R8]|uniref:UvrD-helicase domain-containing protein n=1 Tax=Kineococcus siccus TaxID=2696567 RepID=UPI00141298D6|nr:UvrD-helicase domain-containing protein [Kineococcus siccus]